MNCMNLSRRAANASAVISSFILNAPHPHPLLPAAAAAAAAAAKRNALFFQRPAATATAALSKRGFATSSSSSSSIVKQQQLRRFSKRAAGAAPSTGAGSGGKAKKAAVPLTAKDLLTTQTRLVDYTLSIEDHTTIEQTALMMIQKNVGLLVVIAGGKVAGVVSERDILKAFTRARQARKRQEQRYSDTEAPSAAPAAAGTAATTQTQTAAAAAASSVPSPSPAKPISTNLDDEDLMLAELAESGGLNEWWNQPVERIMTPANKVVFATVNDTVDMCGYLMSTIGVRHLPIVDGENLMGVLSIRDIVKALKKKLKIAMAAAAAATGKKSAGTSASPPSSSSPLPSGSTAAADAFSFSDATASDFPQGIPLSTLSSLLPDINSASGSDMHSFSSPSDSEMSHDGIASASSKAFTVQMILPRKGLGNTSILAEPRHPKPRVQLQSASKVIPHPQKVLTGGEDAHFLLNYVDPESKFRMSAMGVADGVGMWSFERGVDPSKFSRQLMKNAETILQMYCKQKKMPNSPVDVLVEAEQLILESKIEGSSTACLLVLDSEKNFIQAANLGDSGFIVLRDLNRPPAASAGSSLSIAGAVPPRYSVVFRSPQQLRSFNCPYQLGYSAHSKETFELASDAELVQIAVQEGDLIVLATDGLFDNVPEDQVVEIVQQFAMQNKVHDVASLCSTLVKKAVDCSLDKDVDSPFAILAKENNIFWGGGRPDDVTILVGRVTKE